MIKSSNPLGRRTLLAAGSATVALSALMSTSLLSEAAAAPATGHRQQPPLPTIVLVHGAWADASSWSAVTERLQRIGFTVLAAANPLRGLSSDSAYLAAFLAQRVTGPVVLVGHSYGGAVITNAATGNPNVKAIVYINAFVPDLGETVLGLQGPGGDPNALFDFVAYPGAPAGDVDLYIKSALFPSLFAADLAQSTAARLAASQRPIAFSALLEPSAAPAWKTIPSWYVVGTDDHILPAELQVTMAERARSRITRVAASHLSMLSQPATVERVILSAVRSTV